MSIDVALGWIIHSLVDGYKTTQRMGRYAASLGSRVLLAGVCRRLLSPAELRPFEKPFLFSPLMRLKRAHRKVKELKP